MRLLHPWGFPGKNTGVDRHFLLQGIFLTHGLNLHLLQSRALAGEFLTTSTTWEAQLESQLQNPQAPAIEAQVP